MTCGTFPVAHGPAKSVSSSRVARRLSRWASPSAMHAESQLHWCGYRSGASLVHDSNELRCRTPAAS